MNEFERVTEELIQQSRREMQPAPRPKPPRCGDVTGLGYEDTVSCEKRKGHDDPMNEVGGGRTDPIHQETIGGGVNMVVTWWRS